MEREQIIREDFPTVRKGWSPEAVRDHLEAVAESLPAKPATPTPTASEASERVEGVIAAAEEVAAEIVADAKSEADRTLGAARAEAEQIRAAARTESEQTVSAANEEASGRVEQARGAVEGLISQADKLRAQVGALGRDLASNVPGTGSGESIDDEGSLVVPDVAPEPTLTSTASSADKASDDELIARLREAEIAEPVTDPPAPAISGSDDGAVRLVAMNMALEGAPRDRIAKQIKAEFGDVSNADKLIDDVLRRAER